MAVDGLRRVALPSPEVPALRLLRVPAELTLLVTLLRFTGEHLGWSAAWFSTLPGGGLSPIGIVWLIPPVGAFCGWRLQRLGLRPPGVGSALALPLAALALLPALPWLLGRLRETSWQQHLVAWAIGSVLALALVAAGWASLARLLLVYAALARAPVAVVSALSTWLGLGTHYDAVPPGFPRMPVLERWLWIGLLPQATIWVALTVAAGAAFGVLGWLAASRAPR